jgi:fumarylacetoacetate (FAA) hydrolase
LDQGGVGYACIAEVRTVEALLSGEAKTPFLRYGDTIRIEMRDERRHTLFGAIEQVVLPK